LPNPLSFIFIFPIRDAPVAKEPPLTDGPTLPATCCCPGGWSGWGGGARWG
jgi:hypothetical protein